MKDLKNLLKADMYEFGRARAGLTRCADEHRTVYIETVVAIGRQRPFDADAKNEAVSNCK
jgi:hypothetical protein